jgi:hypothetical protein
MWEHVAKTEGWDEIPETTERWDEIRRQMKRRDMLKSDEMREPVIHGHLCAQSSRVMLFGWMIGIVFASLSGHSNLFLFGFLDSLLSTDSHDVFVLLADWPLSSQQYKVCGHEFSTLFGYGAKSTGTKSWKPWSGWRHFASSCLKYCGLWWQGSICNRQALPATTSLSK